MSYNIEVVAGSSKRLPTGGKYCNEDIIVKALYKDVELQEKTVEITESGVYEVTPDSGKLLEKVTAVVDVAGGVKYSEGLLIEWDDSYECYMVKGRGNCTDSVVVIPETYNDGSHGKARVGGLGYSDVYNENGWLTGDTAYVFYKDDLLVEIYLPSAMDNLSNTYSLHDCPNLKKIYGHCGAASFELLNLPSLEYVEFRMDTTYIGGGFGNGSRGAVFDFSKCAAVPTFETYIVDMGMREFGENPTIKVPKFLLTEWKTATNWTYYADYIVAAD